MRWFKGLVFVGLCGCTALNGSYDGVQGDSTGGAVGETGRPGGSGDPPGPGSASGGGTSDSDPGSTSAHATTLDPTDSGSSTTDWPRPKDSGTGATSGDDSSGGWASTGDSSGDNGDDSNRVLILFSAEAWSGSNDDVGVIDGAYQLCAAHAVDDCSVVDAPVPLLRLGDAAPSELLIELGDSVDDPVVGPSNSSIADNAMDLFDGTIDRTLAEAGLDSFGEEYFWTGGLDLTPEHCFNWAAPVAKKGMTGVAGSFLVAEQPFDDADLSCFNTLPIVCACRSVEDPFQ